jgi:hypothetical protein
MVKCPYCEKPVTLEKGDPNEVKRQDKGLGFWRKESMYSCPHCHKVLGFSNMVRG